jgi:alkylhydroperoxidase family enzyme
VGRDVGLTDEEIERAGQPADAEGWGTLDRALLQAADELVRDAKLSAGTWAALDAELDTRQVMDVIFTIGCYDLLAMLIASTELPFDEDLPS